MTVLIFEDGHMSVAKWVALVKGMAKAMIKWETIL